MKPSWTKLTVTKFNDLHMLRVGVTTLCVLEHPGMPPPMRYMVMFYEDDNIDVKYRPLDADTLNKAKELACLHATNRMLDVVLVYQREMLAMQQIIRQEEDGNV